MSIKLIASDLDGTLLTSQKTISEKNAAALENAISKNTHFVPATGRALHSVPDTVLNFPGVEYIITGNGAAIFRKNKEADLSMGNPASAADCFSPIYRCPLTAESIEKIISLPMDPRFTAEIYIDGIPYAESRYIDDPAAFGATGFGIRYVQTTRRPVPDLHRFASENKHRIDSMSLICNDDGLRDEMRLELLETVPDIFLTSAVPHLIEIGHINSGKDKTLSRLLTMLNISPSEVIAFGDADNDAAMLSCVKYGIAMGNATSACKAAACYVTGTNDEDAIAEGIAYVIRPI